MASGGRGGGNRDQGRSGTVRSTQGESKMEGQDLRRMQFSALPIGRRRTRISWAPSFGNQSSPLQIAMHRRAGLFP